MIWIFTQAMAIKMPDRFTMNQQLADSLKTFQTAQPRRITDAATVEQSLNKLLLSIPADVSPPIAESAKLMTAPCRTPSNAFFRIGGTRTSKARLNRRIRIASKNCRYSALICCFALLLSSRALDSANHGSGAISDAVRDTPKQLNNAILAARPSIEENLAAPARVPPFKTHRPASETITRKRSKLTVRLKALPDFKLSDHLILNERMRVTVGPSSPHSPSISTRYSAPRALSFENSLSAEGGTIPLSLNTISKISAITQLDPGRSSGLLRLAHFEGQKFFFGGFLSLIGLKFEPQRVRRSMSGDF